MVANAEEPHAWQTAGVWWPVRDQQTPCLRWVVSGMPLWVAAALAVLVPSLTGLRGSVGAQGAVLAVLAAVHASLMSLLVWLVSGALLAPAIWLGHRSELSLSWPSSLVLALRASAIGLAVAAACGLLLRAIGPSPTLAAPLPRWPLLLGLALDAATMALIGRGGLGLRRLAVPATAVWWLIAAYVASRVAVVTANGLLPG